jgi:small subunit ribosomal protein S8
VSMQDPIADMLTRLRNAQRANHTQVNILSSSIKIEIARVLKEEGYIEDFIVQGIQPQINSLTIKLKYFRGRPVIEKIKRISRPGLRVYKATHQLNAVPGFGISILTTSKGVMSHIQAKRSAVGGEVICEVA